MSQDLGPITVSRKSGAEPFHHDSQPFGLNVLSFWQWSASDLLSNATRGILAEYLVARALGDTEGARAEWDPFDATTESGIRVEVKSSAYLQSWHQNKLSRITFSTRPTFAWEADTSTLAEERKRQADVYVFCLLNHKEQATVDPLDLAQWTFFVISTERLNAKLGEQKSIGLNGLRLIGVEETDYSNLASAVDQAVIQSAV
jgi:hypothetical protein